MIQIKSGFLSYFHFEVKLIYHKDIFKLFTHRYCKAECRSGNHTHKKSIWPSWDEKRRLFNTDSWGNPSCVRHHFVSGLLCFYSTVWKVRLKSLNLHKSDSHESLLADENVMLSCKAITAPVKCQMQFLNALIIWDHMNSRGEKKIHSLWMICFYSWGP